MQDAKAHKTLARKPQEQEASNFQRNLVGGVGPESLSVAATQEGDSEVVYFTWCWKEARTRDPHHHHKSPFSSTGYGQAARCPLMLPGSHHGRLWFSNRQQAPGLGKRAVKQGCGIRKGTAQLWDLFIQGH